MPSNAAKEIKVKIIPAQRKCSRGSGVGAGAGAFQTLTDSCLTVSAAMESTGFLDALNSAPVPGIKIKKKKAGSNNAKAASPTSSKVSERDRQRLTERNRERETQRDSQSVSVSL